jgi:FkbM family methyltransferase
MQSLWLRASRIWCPETTPKVVHTRINEYELLVLANEDVGRAISFSGSYEPAESKYLRKTISSDAICIDIGANVGYFTMLMAQAASRGCVHAFEPIALNAALLRASMELNGFTNIRINQCVVGDSDGVVSFSQSTDSAYSAIRDTQRKPLERTLTVPVTTLDGYLEREGIERVDVLKADVEGAEGLVVTGGSRLLSDEKRRPHVIMLELYDQNLQAFGSSVSTVQGKMQSLRYTPFIVNEEGELVPFRDELKARYYNVLFIPSTKQSNR